MLVQDEILIIGLINEYNIEGRVMLKEIRSICYDYLQVGNMYSTLLEMFRSKGLVKRGDNLEKLDLPYKQVFEVLNSPDYLSAVSDAAPVSSWLIKWRWVISVHEWKRNVCEYQADRNSSGAAQ